MNEFHLENVAEREMAPGFFARMVHSDNMTFAYWKILEGSGLPDHAHPHEQVFNLLEGTFELRVDGESKVFTPGSVVAIMVATTRLICMTPPDTMPGIERLMTFFTSGVSRGQRGTSRMPARRQAIARSAYCAMPEAKRPQAKMYPVCGVFPVAMSHATTFDAIMTTLSNIGAAAAAVKRLRLLRTPDCNAVRDMNSRYGKQMRVRSTASWNVSPFALNPGAIT